MDRTLWPSVILGCLVFALCELTGIDLFVQDHFYNFQSRTWLVDADAKIPRLLFYTGPKALIWVLGLSMIAAAVFYKKLPRIPFARRDIIILIATLATAPALVALGKATTNTFTPSQVRRYNGTVPYVKVIEHYPPGDYPQKRGRGFPAGHASGGFALLALAGLATTRRGRAIGIYIGLIVGSSMGTYQMFKGAHYISHTLVTAFVCWTVFLIWRRIIHRSDTRPIGKGIITSIALLLPFCCILSCSHFVPLPLNAASSAADFSSRSLADPGLRDYQRKTKRSPHGKIWGVAPTEAAAEYFQPDVAVARAKAATALAAITTADTSPNPTLGFAPELGQSAGVDSPWVLGFSLDFPIETAGKRQLRTAQARHTANSAILAATDAIRAARTAARTALLEMEAAAQRTAILTAQSADYDTAISGFRSLMEAGETSRTDLLQTQSLQSRAQLDLADAKRLSETSSAKLAAAIGVPARALSPFSFSYGALEKSPSIPSESRLREAAMTRRPDILAALQDYAAADAGLRLQIAKQYPDLNLSPGYTFDQGQDKWALGVSITLPIDRNLGPIREATAKRAEAAAIFSQVQAKASAELDQALAEIRAARTRISQMEGILAARQKEIDFSEKFAASGEGDSTAAILLKIQLRQDQISLLDARVQLHQALGQLENASDMKF